MPIILKTKVKKGGKVGLMILIILFILTFLVFGITQTRYGRQLILSELVSAIEQSTNATLTYASSDGNIFSGIVLRDVRFTLKTGTAYDTVDIVRANHVLARYSVLRFLRRGELGITSIIISRPQINLVKFAGDTLWNVSLLTKPVAPNQPPPKPWDKVVNLQLFRMQDAVLRVRDYNKAEYPLYQTAAGADIKERNVNFGDLSLEGLDLQGRLFVKGTSGISARIDHLRFQEKRSGFFVHHLEFAAYSDSIQFRMDDAHITTGHSSLHFALELVPPSIIETGLLTSLESSNLKLHMIGPTISTYELKQFLPSLEFLGGSPGIDLNVEGEFGKLHIKKLDLDLRNHGKFHIAGDLVNLHEPEKLYMDLALQAENLSDASVRTYVPGLAIPDLRRLGIVNIPSLTYKGEPLNFATVFDARTSGAGNARGSAALDFRTSVMKYRGDLTFERTNIAAFVPGSNLESNINADLAIDGRGTDWRTLTAAVDISTNAPSSFRDYDFTYLDAAGLFSNGTARVDHLRAAMVGGPVASIESAYIDFKSAQPVYALNGTITDLLLEKFIPTFKGTGIIADIDADISGFGNRLASVTGRLDATFRNLSLKGQRFDDITVNLLLTPRGQANVMHLTSQIADVTIDGIYSLADIAEEIPARIDALQTAIKMRYFPDDADTSLTVKLFAACRDSVDFDFDIRMKDLRPLSIIMPKVMLLATGSISGSVSGCASRDLNLSARSDSLVFLMRDRRLDDDSLPAITVIDTTTGDTTLAMIGVPRVQFTPTAFSIDVHNWTKNPRTVLEDLDMRLEYITGQIARYNTVLLYHPKIQLAYAGGNMNFDLATVVNDRVGVRAKGEASFPDGDLHLTVDTLRAQIDVRGDTNYHWANVTPINLTVTRSGLYTLDTVALVKPQFGLNYYSSFDQYIYVAGQLHGDTINYAWLSAPRLRLENIPHFLPATNKRSALNNLRGLIDTLEVQLSGTLVDPKIETKLAVRNLAYGDLQLDTARAWLRYEDHTVSGFARIRIDPAEFAKSMLNAPTQFNLPGSNLLEIDIKSIPFLLALKKGPNFTRDSLEVYSRPVMATLRSERFPIDIAGPFIPAFTQLHGIGDINLAVTGTLDNIDYRGTADISDGSFLLSGNNLFYTFNGALTFQEDLLRIDHMKINNLPFDDPAGEAFVEGKINFKGFSFQSFDLSLTTNRLMVLNNASRAAIKTVYGPLVISTGGDRLVFEGTLDAPRLGGANGQPGQIIVLSSYLTLPQTNINASSVNSSGIIYRYETVDSLADTVRFSGPVALAASLGGPDLDSLYDPLFPDSLRSIFDEDEVDDPLTVTSAEQASPGAAGTFMDKLQLDLMLSIQGDTWITITFDRLGGLLGEQLNAELKTPTPLYLRKGADRQYHLTGDIEVTDNSTYRFYRPFTITQGKLSFRDDITNPEILIVAEYVAPREDGEARVQLTVTGTKEEPRVQFAIYVRDGAGQWALWPGSQEETQENVVYFLLAGRFKNELSPGEQGRILTSAPLVLSSQLGVSLLNNLLGSTPFRNYIRNVGFDSRGVRVTAAYRDVTLKLSGLGGTRADYLVEVPLSTLANFRGANKAVFQFEGHSGDYDQASKLIQDPQYLMRLLWRIPFPR